MDTALPDFIAFTDEEASAFKHRELIIAIAQPYQPDTLPEPFGFLRHTHLLEAWLNALADALALAPDFEIVYIFMDDAQILKVNRDHLRHDYYTDIITFDYSDPSGPYPIAEIYISLERVLDNAMTLEVPADEELRRVMIHGLLHLAGEDDATDEQKARMRAREDELLVRFPLVITTGTKIP